MEAITVVFSDYEHNEIYTETINDLFNNFDSHYIKLKEKFDNLPCIGIEIRCQKSAVESSITVEQIENFKKYKIDIFGLLFNQTLLEIPNEIIGDYCFNIYINTTLVKTITTNLKNLRFLKNRFLEITNLLTSLNVNNINYTFSKDSYVSNNFLIDFYDSNYENEMIKYLNIDFNDTDLMLLVQKLINTLK